MTDAFENKILRSQILILEAERILQSEGGVINPELRATLTEIAEKARELAGLRSVEAEKPAPAHPADEIMDYATAAEYLHCSYNALRRYVHRRAIPFVRIGGGNRGAVRFQRSVIDQWMREKTMGGRR